MNLKAQVWGAEEVFIKMKLSRDSVGDLKLFKEREHAMVLRRRS